MISWQDHNFCCYCAWFTTVSGRAWAYLPGQRMPSSFHPQTIFLDTNEMRKVFFIYWKIFTEAYGHRDLGISKGLWRAVPSISSLIQPYDFWGIRDVQGAISAMYLATSALNFKMDLLIHLIYLQSSLIKRRGFFFPFLILHFGLYLLREEYLKNWGLVMHIRWKIPPSRKLTLNFTIASGWHSKYTEYLSEGIVYKSCRCQPWPFP